MALFGTSRAPDRRAIVPAQPMDEHRSYPAGGEYGNDQVSERGEIDVHFGDKAPERAPAADAFGNEREHFDPADDDGNHDRHRRNGKIVEQLASRLDERPAVRTEH